MAMDVKQIPPLSKSKHKFNVAAYARVSVATKDTIHSLRAQMDYYKNYIQANPESTFAGLFYDEAFPVERTGVMGCTKCFRRQEKEV